MLHFNLLTYHIVVRFLVSRVLSPGWYPHFLLLESLTANSSPLHHSWEGWPRLIGAALPRDAWEVTPHRMHCHWRTDAGGARLLMPGTTSVGPVIFQSPWGIRLSLGFSWAHSFASSPRPSGPAFSSLPKTSPKSSPSANRYTRIPESGSATREPSPSHMYPGLYFWTVCSDPLILFTTWSQYHTVLICFCFGAVWSNNYFATQYF